jgi:hypothetical protein
MTKKPKRVIKEKDVCNDNLASCFCQNKKGHKGLHECRCGGTWDNNKTPHSLPNIDLGFGFYPNTEDELRYLF